ncbi:MAG: hypothetical protein B7Y99_00970 [Caulobacterales bacterium 32-69-10]|nr:MAG: hypothetical protein B7Y99_00970 [Caulobacterales bacterium 32-69-10]
MTAQTKFALNLCVSTLALTVLGGGAASAQSAAVTDQGGPATTLDEVVVTARKRSETLQDVPTSIVAVSAQQIESLNATSLADLNRITPNARVTEGGTLVIRGIQSNARNAGFEAGAAVYIDGVYQGRPLGNNQDLVDVQRVEVLRGPQGTLYGKNTTAGAISVITASPGDVARGAFQVQYGERNDLRVSGYVAGPLIDGVLGGKLAAYSRTADGYQANVITGGEGANADVWGLRGELRWTPGAWDIALRGDYTRDDSTPALAKAVSGFAAPTASGIDNFAHDRDEYVFVRGGGLSLTVERDLGEFSFTSITGWRSQRDGQDTDDDFSPLNGVYHIWRDSGHQVSQEFRLASPDSNRLSYVLGAYYFGQTLNSNRPVTLSAGFPVQGELRDIVETQTRAYAVFANADYKFTERLILNVGLRYTSEEKDLDFVQFPLPVLGYPAFDFEDSFSDTDLSPTVSLSYKFSPDVTGYAKVSTGYKSGGWNPDITTTPDIQFAAENMTNYEAGLRTRLLEDRLSVNLTAFYMDYKDLQVSQFKGTFAGYVITNAGAATIQGLELEVQARPTSWLTLAGGGAYNDATYDDFDSGTGVNYAGQQITFSPKATAFFTFDARFPVFETAELALQGDYNYTSEIFFDDARGGEAATGPFASDPYEIINLRAGFILQNGLELFAYANNVTDERYLLIRNPDALGLGLTLNRYSPPRQVGARITYRF